MSWLQRNRDMRELYRSYETFVAENQNSITEDRQQNLFGNRATFKGQRNTYKIYGFPEYINIREYYDLYRRNGLAQRLISIMPMHTWQDGPKVTDKPEDESTKKSKFEKEWDLLVRKHNLWSVIYRFDIIQRLGSYGCLLIGAPGKLDSPLPASIGKDMLLYLRPIWQGNARINEWYDDIKDSRYGTPKNFRVEIGRPENENKYTSDENASTQKTETIIVHASRMIMFSESLLENSVYGQPYLEPVMNLLISLDKITHGGAEMAWLNSRGGLHIDTDAALQPPTGVNLEKAKQNYKNFFHSLTRIMTTRGVKVTPIQFQVPSLEPQSNIIIRQLAATTGIPIRMLTGTERGELSSRIDSKAWNDRIFERRLSVGEVILRRIIDKFIKTGILPQPKSDEYFIEWPKTSPASQLENAQTVEVKVRALQNYIASGVEGAIPIEQMMQMLELNHRKNQIVEEKDRIKAPAKQASPNTGEDLENPEDNDSNQENYEGRKPNEAESPKE